MGIKGNPRSGMSWSGMRKVLEQENICSSLKGRIQYFQTRYRGAHDQTGRIAIRLDGEEMFNSDYFKFTQKQWELGQQMKHEMGKTDHGVVYSELNAQGYDYSFYNAFYEYHNNSIEDSLNSADSMVRLFAILDKRVGKRRLKKLTLEVDSQPEWLQIFYRLRIGVEVKEQFDKFYQKHFGDHELLHRVFYGFPIGIRFETGVGDEKEVFLENAKQRTKTIFGELFPEDDDIYILVNDFDDNPNDIAQGIMNTVRPFLNQVKNEHKFTFISQNDPEFSCNRYLFQARVRDIQSNQLIDEIIYGDSWIEGAIYLINPRNRVIFWLYGNEGLDVISDDKIHLKQVYNKYNNWILDYDRERINKVFLSE